MELRNLQQEMESKKKQRKRLQDQLLELNPGNQEGERLRKLREKQDKLVKEVGIPKVYKHY